MSETRLGWPNQCIAKELIERVKGRHWEREWSAKGTAANLAELLQAALDRIEELEADPVDLMKPVYSEVNDLLSALYEPSGDQLFLVSEIQAVLDKYEHKGEEV